jgi:hypothetical protein
MAQFNSLIQIVSSFTCCPPPFILITTATVWLIEQSRLFRTTDLFLMVATWWITDCDIIDRHHLHGLGHLVEFSDYPVDCTRSRSVWRLLVECVSRNLCIGGCRRKRANVRPTEPWSFDDPLRSPGWAVSGWPKRDRRTAHLARRARGRCTPPTTQIQPSGS